LLLAFSMPAGNYGFLDGAGLGSATLVMPVTDPPFSYDMTFAYCLRKVGGLNFGSNYVQVHIEDWAQPTVYQYDDGVGDNLYCNPAGGEICFLQAFDSGPVGDTIQYVSNVYGSVAYPNYGPGNGHPTDIYIWDDPTNDMEPSDCTLLDTVASTIQFEDQDIFVDTQLNSPFPNVMNVFFVGVAMYHTGNPGPPVQFVCPMDTGNIHLQAVWRIGDDINPFNYTILSSNSLFAQNTDGVWMLRAKP